MNHPRLGRRVAVADDVLERAEAAANGGSTAAALALVTAAAEDVERDDPAEAARLLAEAAWYARAAHGPPRALQLARRAAELAVGTHGDVAVIAHARLGDALQWNGRYREARREWLRCGDLRASTEPHVLCAQADALLRAGELSRAREASYAAAARARAHDLPAPLRDALTYQALAEIHLGLLREARESAKEVEAAAGAGSGADRTDALGLLAWIEALFGEEASCRTYIAAAEASAAAISLTPTVGLAAGLLALVLGRYDEAVTNLETRLAPDSPVAATLSLRPFGEALVEACVRSGRDRRAEELVALVVEPALATGQSRYVALALRMRALVASDLADFAAALRHHEAWGNRFEEARTRLLYGEALRRTKRRTDAREQLTAAVAAFRAVGSEGWERRARGELRASGARVPRPASYVPLTSQEERVAKLVADGLSNKEIAATLVLSTKTIEGHLRNIFAKLGVSSRTQVAREILALSQPRS